MRRKRLILCDRCRKELGELTRYGLRLSLKKKMKFTGWFCRGCRKILRSKKS